MSTFQERMQEAITDYLAANPEVTQERLAEMVGVSKGTITNWKRGTVRHIYPPNLVTAARIFGINVLWLATGEGPKCQPSYAVNGTDLSLLRETVITVLTVLETYGVVLPADKTADVIQAAYADAVEDQSPPRKAKVLRLVQLSR